MTTTKKSNKKVNMSNTKQQILDAYEEIVQKLQDADQSVTSHTEDSTDEKITVLLNKQKPKEIVTKIGQLKIEIGEYFSKLTNKLIEETEQLDEIKKAKDRLSEEIKDLHKIKAEASTLQNITRIRKEEEDKLEQELAKMKENLKTDKEKEIAILEDELKKIKTKQKYEEEEYQYQLNKTRREEKDEYEKQRFEIERVLQQREKAIADREDELDNLRKQSEEFEERLKKETERVAKETETEIRRELDTKHNLKLKEIEGEKKLADSTITHLQETVKDQKSEISKLEKQLQLATEQIKDIAVSVINTKKPPERKMTENKESEG